MNETAVTIISAIAFTNLFAISILSWIKKKQHISFLWLSLMFFAPAMVIANNAFIYNGMGSIILYHIAIPLNMVWGGYIISFIKSLKRANDKEMIINWKLFIPALFYLPFFILSIVDSSWIKDAFVLVRMNKLTGFGVLFNIVICVYSVVSNIYLLVWEYYGKEKPGEIATYRKIIKEVLWVLCVLQLLAFVPFAFSFGIEYVIMYMPVFGQIFFIYIFYRLAYSSQIFTKTTISVSEKGRYASVNIDDESCDEIQSRIQQLMEVDKPYLEADFTLAELSSQMSLPAKTISMIVNSKLKSSFPDFVNSYRVKFAIELLKDFKKNNLTIEAVAYDSGFNNRTCFYNAFKKQTGKLPGDFVIDRARKI